MVSKVQKWGNSQGPRLPKAVLEEVQIGVGDEVMVSTRGGQIIVAPVKKARQRYDIRKLVAKIPKGYRAREIDWGLPVGEEIWSMPRRVPEHGDFVILSFDPQSGHGQKGRRPALVISNAVFNRHTGLAMVCPITNTFRDYPFHVPVPAESSLTGYIMAEQIKASISRAAS